MGFDSTATLAYGFIIPPGKFLDNLNDGNEQLPKELDNAFHGSDDTTQVLLIVKKSEIRVDYYEDLKRIDPKRLDPKRFEKGDTWDILLRAYAASKGVKKPKIGWYLCASFG